jgi:hypothetical protein
MNKSGPMTRMLPFQRAQARYSCREMSILCFVLGATTRTSAPSLARTWNVDATSAITVAGAYATFGSRIPASSRPEEYALEKIHAVVRTIMRAVYESMSRRPWQSFPRRRRR